MKRGKLQPFPRTFNKLTRGRQAKIILSKNQPNEELFPWLIAMLEPSGFIKPDERLYPLRCRYSECICCWEDCCCCCWLFRAVCWSCWICCTFRDWFCIWKTCCPPRLEFWPEPLLSCPVATLKRWTSSLSASCKASRNWACCSIACNRNFSSLFSVVRLVVSFCTTEEPQKNVRSSKMWTRPVPWSKRQLTLWRHEVMFESLQSTEYSSRILVVNVWQVCK